MKLSILASTLVLLCSSVQAQDRPEFADVEVTHWTYAATRKASDWIFPEGKSYRWFNGRRRVPWTRYEFAVATCRMEDELSLLKTPPLYPERQARDIVAALHREFENEVSRLQMRDPFSEIPRRLNPPVIPPPRLTITPSILLPIPKTELLEDLPPMPKP